MSQIMLQKTSLHYNSPLVCCHSAVQIWCHSASICNFQAIIFLSKAEMIKFHNLYISLPCYDRDVQNIYAWHMFASIHASSFLSHSAPKPSGPAGASGWKIQFSIPCPIVPVTWSVLNDNGAKLWALLCTARTHTIYIYIYILFQLSSKATCPRREERETSYVGPPSLICQRWPPTSVSLRTGERWGYALRMISNAENHTLPTSHRRQKSVVTYLILTMIHSFSAHIILVNDIVIHQINNLLFLSIWKWI